MGNCCGGGANEGEVSITAKGGKMDKYGTAGFNHILDDREIGGLKGADKIYLIIKLQSIFRGYIARKRVKQRHGFVASTMGQLNRMGASEFNYSNPRVQAIKERLGKF
jgi:hypothetical protein